MLTEKLTQATQDGFILTNIVEDVVAVAVQHAIKDMDMCICDKCQLNARALALNALPVKYVTTTKGSLLAEAGFATAAFQFQVVVQVSKALKIVKECPLH